MLLTTLLLACGTDHTKDAAEAVVTEAKKEAPAEETAGARELKVDPAKSQLRVIGAKVVGSHPIDFKDYTGTIAVDGDQVKKIAFDVDMTTLKSDDDRLTAHLLNEDFFHVEKFPKSSFVSTSIKPSTEGGGTHEVTGNLTVRGNTKSVTFPATITMNGDSVEAKADFVVDRQDFDIVYKGKADNLIQDEVAMKIAFVAG